ncbi:hypothetical protein [Celeribacter neptunius]|uniref:hypothetical protein n=1 Tax=Celeribacter neptunius TaxID=588602 RepID=UPI00116052B5|nr:hypothetical protein [Celeribacter neptunius]
MNEPEKPPFWAAFSCSNTVLKTDAGQSTTFPHREKKPRNSPDLRISRVHHPYLCAFLLIYMFDMGIYVAISTMREPAYIHIHRNGAKTHRPETGLAPTEN